MSETYHEPIAQLLTLGDPRDEGHTASAWRDYLALGFTAEHVPELVRMATDQDLHRADLESVEVWAPLHAWRALGQLRAEGAVEPLLQQLNSDAEDDWAQMDLPMVFAMIGPVATPALRVFMADTKHGRWARIAVGEGLVKMVERFPESREPVVAIITEQLRHFDEQERVVNAFLVEGLCDLGAVESAAVIEQAFAADKVDLSVVGDWEEAQILLGLLEERLTPAPNYLAMEFGPLPSFATPPTARSTPRKASKEKKAKRKQAKASRKRNRGR